MWPTVAEMGAGYGSEAHLLRFLGRHRRLFDELVLEATGLQQIEWLDFKFDPKSRWQDAEWTGLDFIEGEFLQARWREFWPTTGTPPNWDAVARIGDDTETSWLLVEAKANTEELQRSTGAGPVSREKISAAFEQVKSDLGVDPDRNWLEGYYQFCFQVAVLWFLQHHGVSARLLYGYFVGDKNPGYTCPANTNEWHQKVEAMKTYVGLPERHGLSGRIHHVFVAVTGPTTTALGTRTSATP